MGEIAKTAGLVILNLVPAVLIPAMIAYFKWLTESESILLGVLIWILMTCADILYHVNSLREEEKHEIVLWKTQDALDVRLSNIRNAYRKVIVYKRSDLDLYQTFVDDRVAELERMTVEAAERGKLHIERGHLVSTDVLLASFTGEKEDIFRAVHFLQDNDFFFTWARQYFYRVYELVQAKKIREVKRLMVYENDEELRDPRSIKLMRFHAVTDRYSYKVIRMQDFRSLVHDYRLDISRDFGIYGDKYVYCAQTNVIDNITGYWLRGPAIVRSFIYFFDKCWATSPLAFSLRNIDTTEEMTLEELFVEQHVDEGVRVSGGVAAGAFTDSQHAPTGHHGA